MNKNKVSENMLHNNEAFDLELGDNFCIVAPAMSPLWITSDTKTSRGIEKKTDLRIFQPFPFSFRFEHCI